MTDTPQGAWMREYERRRAAVVYAAGDHGKTRLSIYATEGDRDTSRAALTSARTELDAHVRGLVEEWDADARRLARRLANATPPSLDYPNGYTRLAERFHAILTDAAMAADTQTEGESDGAQ